MTCSPTGCASYRRANAIAKAPRGMAQPGIQLRREIGDALSHGRRGRPDGIVRA
jgi:hypothetical protein